MSNWKKIRATRLRGLENTILYYEELYKSGHQLSVAQRSQLEEEYNELSAMFGKEDNDQKEIQKEYPVVMKNKAA